MTSAAPQASSALRRGSSARQHLLRCRSTDESLLHRLEYGRAICSFRGPTTLRLDLRACITSSARHYTPMEGIRSFATRSLLPSRSNMLLPSLLTLLTLDRS